MRDPLLPSFSCSDSSASPSDSWLHRVRENLAQLLLPSPFHPSSANGAPIHLLKFEKSLRPARAQSASLLTHAAIFAAVFYILAHPQIGQPPLHLGDGSTTIAEPSRDFLRKLFNPKLSDGSGHGSNNDLLPAKHGNLPPFSSLVLVKPSLPQNRESTLPVPPALFDPNAAPVLKLTPDIGLPWMPDDTNSGGKAKGHGIGSKDGNDLGDGKDGPAGFGSSTSPYGPGFVSPICSYCPSPTYTDDARHGKVQGIITLQVLVGADGRAQDIRIVRGVGFGLDERAVETIRSWKFIPAHDSSRRSVPAWVTIETTFRLF